MYLIQMYKSFCYSMHQLKFHKSALTPNPGPLGGSVRDVKPFFGSDENLKPCPLLKQN